jgi:hypothetical protein
MLRAVIRRFTFSNVLAIIALFIALGGSVYAAGKTSGKTIKKNSEPGNRIKKDTVTGKQVNEDSLGPVPKARALVSAGGSTVQATRFARINADGSLDATDSSGVTQADYSRGTSGWNCFKTPVPRNVQATAIAPPNAALYANVVLDSNGIKATGACPSGTTFAVVTLNAGSIAPAAVDVAITP